MKSMIRGRSLAGARRASLSVAAALAAGALGAGAFETLFAAPTAPAGPLARDEEFVLKLSGAAKLARIVAGGITVTSPAVSTAPDPVGTFVAGRTLIDPSQSHAVVVRPEAVREYFEIVKGLSREDAEVQAARTLAKIEKTGNYSLLNEIDRALQLALGLTMGTRLDDLSVSAHYPSQLNDTTADNDSPLTFDPGDSPLEPYRTRIAGDDELWHRYLVEGDINGFSALEQNKEYERFHHTVDVDTGIRRPQSVLRERIHRQVLFRRVSNFVTFVPAIPNKADLSDAGFASGATYAVTAHGQFKSRLKALVPALADPTKFVKGSALLTITADPGDGGPFLGGIPATAAQAPVPWRVVNTTPPNGESEIDPTTDWEDPDNQFITPIPLRRRMVVRLRFNVPLDPRTVDAQHFLLRKVAVVGATGIETPVDVPVTTTVTLKQTRLGEILVEVRPSTTLDPAGKYEVRVDSTVRSLAGRENAISFVSAFQTR